LKVKTISYGVIHHKKWIEKEKVLDTSSILDNNSPE